MYRRLSRWIPAIASGMIATGAVLAFLGPPGAFTPGLTRYTFGDRGPGVADIPSRLPAALHSDLWLIAGYGAVLAGCALICRARANSELDCLMARFIGAAVVVAVLASVAQDVLLWSTLRPAWDTDRLRTATAAAAIVKMCTLAVAAVGLIGSAWIVVRGATAAIGRVWRRPWWEGVLARKELPDPKPTDEAVKESGGSVAKLMEDQQSWLNAYNVPGVTAALKGRTEPLRALCLSGGGVRSACVAMGAMQVFSSPLRACDAGATWRRGAGGTLLEGFDYVISVSGGGYAAGARLLGVQGRRLDRDGKPKPLPPDQILDNVAALSERFEEGSEEFDHVRRGSSYIADSPLGLVRALGQVLKNLVASLATIFSVPVLAGAAIGWLLARIPIAAFPPVPPGQPAAETKQHQDYFLSLFAQPAAYWAVGFFAVWAVLLTLIALAIEWKWAGPMSEDWRAQISGWARASAGFALVVFAVTIAIPGLMRLCRWAGDHTPSGPGSAFAAVSGVVGLNYLAALTAMVWRDKDKLAERVGANRSVSFLKRVLPPEVIALLLTLATLAVLLLVWLALLGSFAAGVFDYDTKDGWGPHRAVLLSWHWWWLGGLAFTTLFLGFADVTSLSLHPFYRRRLARTFAVRRTPDTGQPNAAEPYPASEPTWLHLYGRTGRGPQFVFACSATITGPDKPAPGLNAVSYVMSADYIGGPELGWFRTRELFAASPARIRRDLTVQAAVAVSGAAFASAMGRQDKGIEKLLAISGARLGTWLPNPNFVRQLEEFEERRSSGADPAGADDLPRVWPASLPSVRGAGYLYREILGINNKNARLVQVTDGGHYDNSGLVEALRRRCQLIFVIDGGGDPPPLPLGLTDALRLAKYELGVDVTLNQTGAYSVEAIAPGSGTRFSEDNALAGLNDRITRGAVVEGTITYPAAAGLRQRTGRLIFVKAVVSQACPYWLLTYAAANEIFPHDPTSDQWFNEGQFAAYTELGRVIAREAVECLANGTSVDARRHQDADEGQPHTGR
ncbi:hypothetical protein [Mycobacterium palustre]|nr:hypothetical protein [Mycobacterium palustre]MCV7100139.1 hypothetical protein [Mycobacterium palustre]